MDEDFEIIPVVADGSDQSALINHWLATSSASVLKLPPGVFWIGSTIHVPDGKTLIGSGQGQTSLNVLDSFDPLVDNHAIALGDNTRLADFTLDGQKVGLGEGAAQRICGVVGIGVGFLVEDMTVVDVTGYSFWAFGDNTPAPPASGVFRDCYAENANILFETTDADGVLFERCVGADGDGDIPIASAFHPAASSQNVTFLDCEYTGYGIVVDVLANVGDMANILFQNVHGTTTGPANAVYIVGAGRNAVVMIDSSFVALQGYGLSIYNSDFLALRSSFESTHIAATIDANSTAHFSDSQLVTEADPGAAGLAWGLYSEGDTLFEGGGITVSGPPGSTAYIGNATVIGASVNVQGLQQSPGETKNVVSGGSGPDVVTGTTGDDALYSRDVSPSYARPFSAGLYVAPLLDTLAEIDQLLGDAGNDRLFAGYGDQVDGGAGNDTLLLSYRGATSGVSADFRPLAGGGTATIAGATISGVEGIEWLEGSNFADTLRLGDAAADGAPIFGLGGNDTLIAGRHTGSIFGGDGNDWINLIEAEYSYDHFGEAGSDYVRGGKADDRVFGGDGNDSLFGYEGADLLDGGAGADTIDGGIGNDRLDGGAGDDLVKGDAGDDVLLLNDGGDDEGLGGDGDDLIYFGAALGAGDVANGGIGRDAIVLQGKVIAVLSNTNLVGIESISIQSGANTAFGDTLGNSYDFNVTTANGNVLAGQQLIVNAQSLRAGEDFTFDGSAETDGTFLVHGGHGVDKLKGGSGGDVFFFEGSRWGATDRVDGGGGGDAVVISAPTGLNHFSFGASSLTNIESILLNNLYSTDPSQKPSYDIVLHNGSFAASGTLVVNGSAIPAGQRIQVDGQAVTGKLILFGSGGNDTLSGGGGADTIVGGARTDNLAGRGGADVFRYDSASDSTAASWDLIGDFQVGVDKIDLSRIDADTTVAGDQAFHWIGASAFSGDAGELRVFDAGNFRWRVEGDINGDGTADLVIMLTHQGAILPGQGDFLF